MSKPHEEQISRLLPFEAAAKLVRASQTPITSDDPLARVRAINEASDFAKTFYPRFFQKDPS